MFKAKFLQASSQETFYHGSNTPVDAGTILEPSDDYEQRWGYNWWYQALERYRPKHMLAHEDAVFMCGSPNDIDAAGGGMEYLCIVEPLGRVEQHDMSWGSAIEIALETHEITDGEE
jgi:hypothetical protein